MCTILEDHLQPVFRYSLDEYYQQLSQRKREEAEH